MYIQNIISLNTDKCDLNKNINSEQNLINRLL